MSRRVTVTRISLATDSARSLRKIVFVLVWVWCRSRRVLVCVWAGCVVLSEGPGPSNRCAHCPRMSLEERLLFCLRRVPGEEPASGGTRGPSRLECRCWRWPLARAKRTSSRSGVSGRSSSFEELGDWSMEGTSRQQAWQK